MLKMDSFIACYVTSVYDNIAGIYIMNNGISTREAFEKWLAESHKNAGDYRFDVYTPKFVKQASISFHSLEEIGL